MNRTKRNWFTGPNGDVLGPPAVCWLGERPASLLKVGDDVHSSWLRQGEADVHHPVTMRGGAMTNEP